MTPRQRQGAATQGARPDEGLRPEYVSMLERALRERFVGHLPPITDPRHTGETAARKDLSRALSAFAVHHLTGAAPALAAESVTDDYDDFGLDAVHYDGPAETLYLVQSKLQPARPFGRDEALDFSRGVRKLLAEDFDGFNQFVQDRRAEIEHALSECSHIRLVVAHAGPMISRPAMDALREVLDGDEDERLHPQLVDYDARRIVDDLRSASAYAPVNARLSVEKCASVQEPRPTYFGIARLADLVALHEAHGEALYERNIRHFLGRTTDVNRAIRQTLQERPQDFFYFNNGVTAVCREIQTKGRPRGGGGRRELKLHGVSIINGAQTIASAAEFARENADRQLHGVNVPVTLIAARADDAFGQAVTRARNHQNPVPAADFVALDAQQERLRREATLLGVRYSYKAEARASSADPREIRVAEAAQALAVLHRDPRYAVWLRNAPARILDTGGEPYRALFNASLTALRLINAVYVHRYIRGRITEEVRQAARAEQGTYAQGEFALAWVLAKRMTREVGGSSLIDPDALPATLGAAFDTLRQVVLTAVQKAGTGVGPRALFGHASRALPLLESIALEDYGLQGDPAVAAKKRQQPEGEPYPVDLWAYILDRAPQLTSRT